MNRKQFGTFVRARIYRLCGKACGYCYAPLAIGEMTIDHVVPLSKGGAHTLVNLLACCHRCNCIKGDKMPTAIEMEQARDVWSKYRQRKEAQRPPKKRKSYYDPSPMVSLSIAFDLLKSAPRIS